MKKTFLVSLFIAVMVFASSCVVQQNPVSGNKRAFAYSWQQEIQLGQEADGQIIAEYGLYDDDTVEEYVVLLGEKLLAESHMRRESTSSEFRETEFAFRVLNSPVVNAFALPGGYVYITRGLMAHLNNEAQLAVVIGHEIGHVAARHASQRGLQQTLGGIAVVGGAILGQELLGLPGGSILEAGSAGAQFLFLSYGRNHERESDRLGVEYAALTGYDAAEGATFFTSLKRISDKAGQSIPSLLSTHPDPGERELNIPRMAEEWKEQGYEQTVRNTVQYMQYIDGMIFGDNPREGFVEGGAFVHPDLEFQYPVPSGWAVLNQASQVVIMSPDRDAVMILRIDSESSSAQESVRAFITQDGVDVKSQGSATSSNQWQAYEADVSIEDGGEQLGVHLYSVEYGGRVYRFINYTTEDKFSNYRSDFSRSTSNFDALTDTRLLNINPVTLRVMETDRSRPFREFLPSSLPMDIDPEDIAILNQVEMDDVVDAGTLIKIPVQ